MGLSMGLGAGPVSDIVWGLALGLGLGLGAICPLRLVGAPTVDKTADSKSKSTRSANCCFAENAEDMNIANFRGDMPKDLAKALGRTHLLPILDTFHV